MGRSSILLSITGAGTTYLSLADRRAGFPHQSSIDTAFSLAREQVAVVVDEDAVGIFLAAEAAVVASGVGTPDGGHGRVQYAPALLADIVPPLAHGDC